MSSTNKSSFIKPGNPSPSGSYEDDLLTWLQYPPDDVFEKSYCADAPSQGGWSLAFTEGFVKSNVDAVSHQPGSISNTGTSICETSSMPSASHLRKHMDTTLIPRSSHNVSAEEALAQGAARAAGISSGIAHGTYNKVKTLMQPIHAPNPTPSAPHYSINACKEFKDRQIKPSLPVSSVSGSAPTPLQDVKIMKPNVLESSPLFKTKRAVSELATSSSKRARTECEAHSHTHQTDSSRITEEDIMERDKMVVGPRWRCEKSPTSYSGTSQSSMSLSGRETLYSGKHKQDLELLTEDYAEDDSMDMKKQCRPPSKRNRVAEVHNLSERNRRNRINDKLKTLQDLIPNSSKTDKASVLDEAIEYMKTLQMQLQMVTMRNSFNVSPMMMPMNLPQPQMHLAQSPAIGLGVPIGHAAGMGMCLGLGMPETAGPPKTTTLLQYPAGVSQLHAMPFYSGNMAGFPHMGFYQNNQMQNMQEPCELSAQRPAYMHQHQQYEQERSLLHQPCIPENEAGSLEQEDDLDD